MILIPQLGMKIEHEAGVNLLTLLVRAKVPLAHSCAGSGVCGTCTVKIKGEKVPPSSDREERLRRKQNRDATSSLRYCCLLNCPDPVQTWEISTDYW